MVSFRGGVLSGKYNAGTSGDVRFNEDHPFSKLFLTDRNLSISSVLNEVAGELGKTSAQVALRWVLEQQHRAHAVIPIVGAKRSVQLKENLGCLEFTLPCELHARLDKVSAIELGYPHDFMRNERVAHFVYGNVEYVPPEVVSKETKSRLVTSLT